MWNERKRREQRVKTPELAKSAPEDTEITFDFSL
jgi:hypothetical protein